QGGGAAAANTAGLESLGTVAYEPLWWFRRRGNQGGGGGGLRRRQNAIGAPGSGARPPSPGTIQRNGGGRPGGGIFARRPRSAGAKPRKSSRRERSMSRS